mmetsp:Transcript_38139/g.96487  ORF Transcript_38139/g.96487 Transcript_38139/m.96487 type:complete len:348 (-) Transcript_38139:530-1573(-)
MVVHFKGVVFGAGGDVMHILHSQVVADTIMLALLLRHHNARNLDLVLARLGLVQHFDLDGAVGVLAGIEVVQVQLAVLLLMVSLQSGLLALAAADARDAGLAHVLIRPEVGHLHQHVLLVGRGGGGGRARVHHHVKHRAWLGGHEAELGAHGLGLVDPLEAVLVGDHAHKDVADEALVADALPVVGDHGRGDGRSHHLAVLGAQLVGREVIHGALHEVHDQLRAHACTSAAIRVNRVVVIGDLFEVIGLPVPLLARVKPYCVVRQQVVAAGLDADCGDLVVHGKLLELALRIIPKRPLKRICLVPDVLVHHNDSRAFGVVQQLAQQPFKRPADVVLKCWCRVVPVID